MKEEILKIIRSYLTGKYSEDRVYLELKTLMVKWCCLGFMSGSLITLIFLIGKL